EVVHAHGALVVLPDRLEHESLPTVAARRRTAGGRREQPAAVVGVAEQRREAGAGVEAWEAQPVDRAAPLDERGGLQVADEGVVFYTSHRHRFFAVRSNVDSYSSTASPSSVCAKRSRMSASRPAASSSANTSS